MGHCQQDVFAEAPADVLNKVEAGSLRAIDAENLGITNNTLGKAVDHLGRVIRCRVEL